MNLQELVNQLVVDTNGGGAGGWLSPTADSSIGVFLPELTLCATIVAMLLLRMLRVTRNVNSCWVVVIGMSIALFLCAPWRHLGAGLPDASEATSVVRMEIFTGMLVIDPLALYLRSVLILFALLFAVFTRLTGIPDREDGPDIYTLVLGSTLGMCLMASANHLLMVFMAVEMASVPSYALAGLMKGKREGSEAALKYAVYGAGAAGVMLYGISLIAGLLNTAHIPTLAMKLAERLPNMAPEETMVVVLAGLMIMVGLAFKLSAVPFHFWCPDVFEGAAAEVNAFLSVASKAAALGLLLRVAIGLATVPPESVSPGARSSGQVSATISESTPSATYFVSAEPAKKDNEQAGHGSPSDIGADRQTRNANLAPARIFIAKVLALLAAITCTFGNLAAYGQTNIKRLLAYSTIAHAGYMMMPVSAVLVMIGQDTAGAMQAVGGLGLYIFVYVFMNLGAFAIVAFLRNAMHSEQIDDYSGLIRRCPITVVCFCLILFALIGLPPLSGFIGKFAIFGALMNAYRVGGPSATFMFVLLLVGGINSAISLFYYLRVVKVMTIDPESENRRPLSFPEVSLQGAFICLLTLPTAVLFLAWDRIHVACLAAARFLFS